MDILDTDQEWRRLTELYRGKADEELLILAQQPSELTHIAQQVLSQELGHRGLEMPEAGKALSRPLTPPPEADPESPYAEDRKLVQICTVWSLRDAKQVHALLDQASMPHYLGLEHVEDPEDFKTDFSVGIALEVMNIGQPGAMQVLAGYAPLDDPSGNISKDAPEEEVFAIHCPKCHSDEIMLGDSETEPEAKPDVSSDFLWTCEACGHRWQGDSVET